MHAQGKGKGSSLGLDNWMKGEKWSGMVLNKLRKLERNRIVGEDLELCFRSGKFEDQVVMLGRYVGISLGTGFSMII